MKKYAPVVATAPTVTSGGSNQSSRCCLRLLILPRLDEIAEPADRADLDPGRLELGAQPRDVDLDRVGRHVFVPRGDRARDLVLGHDGLDVGEEVREDRELALRKVER